MERSSYHVRWPATLHSRVFSKPLRPPLDGCDVASVWRVECPFLGTSSSSWKAGSSSIECGGRWRTSFVAKPTSSARSRVPRRLPHPRPAARRYPPALRRRLAVKATPPNPIMRLLHSWSSEMCWDETAGNREVVSRLQYPQPVRLGSARAVVGVDEMRHRLKAEEIRVGRRREEDIGR